MSELVQRDENLPMAEVKGRLLYKNNQHYRNIATVMEHPEFRNFYDMYMSGDCDNTRVIMMFLKIYEAIEKHSKVELTAYQKIAVMDKILADRELRREAVVATKKWLSDDTTSVFPLGDTSRSCIESNTDAKRCLE